MNLKVLFMIWTAVEISYSQMFIDKYCLPDNPSHCFTIYEQNRDWHQAALYCNSINASLAAPVDDHTFNLLMAQYALGSYSSVWIAGQWLADSRWRTLENDEVNPKVNGSLQTDGNCMYVELNVDSSPTFGFKTCGHRSFRTALCQRQMEGDDSCLAQEVQVDNLCFSIHITGSNKHWFESVSDCSNLNMSMAHNMDAIRKLSTNRFGAESMWLGIYRYPFVWTRNTGQILLTYVRFYGGGFPPGNLPSENRCFYIYAKAWQVTSCTGDHKRLFMCETVTLAIPTTTPRPTYPSTTLIGPGTEGKNSSSTSNGGGLELSYIVLIVVVVVLVAVIIIVVVIIYKSLQILQKQLVSNQPGNQAARTLSVNQSYIETNWTSAGSQSTYQTTGGSDDNPYELPTT